MSREHFEQNRVAIENAVKLLLADGKRRIKFQLATVYEKRTGDLLVEVLSTSFGPVVVYWTGHAQPSLNSAWVRPRQDRRSRSNAPLTCELHQTFDVFSRSNANYDIRGVDLIRVITGDVDPTTLPSHREFVKVGDVMVRSDSDGVGALTFRCGVSGLASASSGLE